MSAAIFIYFLYFFLCFFVACLLHVIYCIIFVFGCVFAEERGRLELDGEGEYQLTAILARSSHEQRAGGGGRGEGGVGGDRPV